MKIQEAIKNSRTQNRIVRYGLKPLAWIAGFILVIWVILWVYVITHEEYFKNKVSNAIQQKTRGQVNIGGLSVSFFRTFPILSLQLKNVVIRDSVTAFNHKEFLKASDIYLRLSIPGMIKGGSPIGKVLIRKAEINVISDTSGNTNEYIFKSKPGEKRQVTATLPDLELQNVSILYKDPKRKKNYSGYVHSFKCSPESSDSIIRFKVKTRLLARNIAFNTIAGAYMKEKMIEGKFSVTYNRESKDIIAENVKLYLDNHPFFFNGKFNLDKNKGDFNLNIHSQQVMFAQGASLLTIPIQKALRPYSANDPVDIVVKLSGKTTMNFIPLVEVFMEVRNNKVITPQGLFEDCSFNGYFSNELVKGKEKNDRNSYLLFKKFTGRWEDIRLVSDTIKISNLITPYLECDVASDVDMKTLSKLADSKTFKFLDGKTSFNIDFKGQVLGGDSSAATINGRIDIVDVSMKYNPRNIVLSDCSGSLRFINNDLIVNKLNAVIGKTKLLMNGSAANFLSMLNVSPEKMLLKWNIKSPEINLTDFTPLLSPSSKSGTKPKTEGTIARTSSKIDKMFTDGDMYISLESPVMEYKTFHATGVKADVVFTPVEIKLDRVLLNHAGGSMNVKGLMKNGAQKNPVTLNVNMQKMDIPELFAAFNNFGQDAVTNKNLKGKLSANINFKTSITNKAALVQDDSEGSIDFLLEGGELNNFEPLKEISQKAFKKQDFSDIRFADLKNKLDLKGTTFIINSMDIRSTALNLTVEGVYDFKKGTDMFIKLPLRNLLKSQSNTDISDDGKAARGVSLRLRAKTGDDGKLKVSWDPLRLSKKNKKDVIDSTSQKN
ncbi:MAG TPA: AsmA-like C-terminal region-containing protein [Flavitalea sp.]|nr:AsmA-like C-terminal region-containing protein [Flavitalea sp.]